MKRRRLEMVLGVLVGLQVLAAAVGSATIWSYSAHAPENIKFEKFGPRADKLLIKLFDNETAEWDALAAGEIDIAQCPLSREYYDMFTSNMVNPATGLAYNETINTTSYAEFNTLILEINNNNNEYLGNPPDPTFANPVYPNPTSVKEMRQAIAHLTNRTVLDTVVGKSFYDPLYTVVPPCQGAYSNLEIRPGGALENLTYLYSKADAEVLLDAGGFPVNTSTGWRFWDRNDNGIEESDEYLELKFYIRNDVPARMRIGNSVADELSTVKIRVNCTYGPTAQMFEVFFEKNFHLYTGGWMVSTKPEQLTVWLWDSYWHPNYCLNFAGVNNPEYEAAVHQTLSATTLEDAVAHSKRAQIIFAENAHVIPVMSYVGNKAMNRFYTGGNKWQNVTPDDGENQYRGQILEGTVNMPIQLPGQTDSWSLINVHPQGFWRGDGENMTIRWGFNTGTLKSFNPIYSSGLWEWNVLNLIFDPLIKRNPNNTSNFIPWLAEDLEIENYSHPIYESGSKIKIKLRPDITWHDGTPLTATDVFFTFIELSDILSTRGVPPPWWHESIVHIQDFKLCDPYNFEILLDSDNPWILDQLSHTIVLPKHIWKPIAETGPIGNPTPDPNLIGSGPWRLREYIQNSHALLVINQPGCTVQTNLPSSSPITSPKGYHRYLPLTVEARINGTTNAKVDYDSQPYTLNYTIYNLHSGPLILDIFLTHPDGTAYNETTVLITAHSDWEHSWTGDIQGTKTTSLVVNINDPTWFEGTYGWSQTYYGTRITHRSTWFLGWIPNMHVSMAGPDIAGSTFYDDIGLFDYPYKNQLPTPDIKSDIKDLSLAARAFGSYPGHKRWGMGVADVNNDYKVDIKDVATFAKEFGWSG
ncbi:MAG: hypothetical protein JSW72_07720 [Candidatus Bathyarchaeota archaeon]|nr:MAG: hypothetical protein JSW72_07720 [Candidatus Bathyarchaeota archaeon]